MAFNYAENIIRRSRLIMPANEKRFVEKAYLRNADAIVLDLEDSVPMSQKLATRELIKDLIPVVGKGGSDVLVRVNHTEELLRGDIEASVWAGVDEIYFPKAENGEQVREVDQIISHLEQKRGLPLGHIKIGIIIETVKGYLNMREIIQASDRIDSLTLGAEDFAVDSGIEMCDDTYHGMLIPRMQVLFTARAYGKIPLGLMGSIAGFNDSAGFRKNALLAYKHGFHGASCIHPNNVEILNEAFSPTQEDVEYSQKVIEAFESSVAKGRASTTLEGKMIDTPHYEKAKQLLERAIRIEKFEFKKKRARESADGGGAR